MTTSRPMLRPIAAALFASLMLAACGGPRGDQARKQEEPLPGGAVVTTHQTGLDADTLAAFLNPFFEPYVRALYLTSKGDAGAAAALDSAHAAWKTFSDHAPKVYTDDLKWPGHRDDVETALVTATARLRAGDPAAAHEALEVIRKTLSAQNDEVGIIGWPDLLLTFHDPVEELAAANDPVYMRSQVVAIRLALAKLGGFPMGGFDAAERELLQVRLTEIATALDSVEIAMGDGSAGLAEPHRHAADLKKSYVDLYVHSKY